MVYPNVKDLHRELFPDKKVIHEEVITPKETPRDKEDKEKSKYTKILEQANLLKTGGGISHTEPNSSHKADTSLPNKSNLDGK